MMKMHLYQTTQHSNLTFSINNRVLRSHPAPESKAMNRRYQLQDQPLINDALTVSMSSSFRNYGKTSNQTIPLFWRRERFSTTPRSSHLTFESGIISPVAYNNMRPALDLATYWFHKSEPFFTKILDAPLVLLPPDGDAASTDIQALDPYWRPSAGAGDSFRWAVGVLNRSLRTVVTFQGEVASVNDRTRTLWHRPVTQTGTTPLSRCSQTPSTFHTLSPPIPIFPSNAENESL